MSTRPGPQSYHDILGVSPSASPEAIEQAYRARVREVRDLPGGGDRTHQLTIAYRALKGAEKRRSHDAAPGGGAPRARVVPKSAFLGAGAGAAAAATLAPRPAGATGQAAAMPEVAPRAPAESPPDAAIDVPPAPEPLRAEPEPVAQEAAPVEAVVPLREPAPVREEPASFRDEPTPAAYENDSNREQAWAEAEPAYLEPVEHEPRGRRRTGLYALAALIGVGLLALLLLVGRNNGPAPGQAPMAQADAGTAPSGTGTGAGTEPSATGELASAAPQEEGGLLSDILGSLGGPSEAPTLAAPPVPVPAGRQAAAAEAEAAGTEVTEEQVEVAEATDEVPAAEAPEEPRTETAVASAPPPPPPAAATRPAPRVSRASAARYLGGGLVDADNAGGRFAGSVGVRFTVLPNGRTASCRVTRSSGNPGLDATTCNLLQQRLRFTPATDDDGRPVVSEVGSVYTWGRTPGRSR